MKESDIVLDIIKTRRSVRRFDGTKIPGECMQQILEAGRWAPSGANAQPWRFIVVTEKEKLATLAECCYYKVFKSRHVGEAGAVVVICADPEAGSQTYQIDAAFEEQTIRSILRIPSNLRIIALIAFGYEVGKASAPPRLPLSSIVHYEIYDDKNEPGIIKRKKSSGAFSVLGKLLHVLFNRR